MVDTNVFWQQWETGENLPEMNIRPYQLSTLRMLAEGSIDSEEVEPEGWRALYEFAETLYQEREGES